MNHKDKRFNFRPTNVDHYDNGKGFCRFCGKPAGKGCTRYCSNECRIEVAIRMNASSARFFVEIRDKGICAICKVDTNKQIRKTAYGATHTWEADHIMPVSEGGGGCGLEGYRTLCIKCHGKESGALRKRLNKNKSPQKRNQKKSSQRLLF